MREEQLKNLGRLLAALDNELSLNTNQLSKAIGTPLAIFPWAIKEASINPKNPGIIQQAIARLDVENASPPDADSHATEHSHGRLLRRTCKTI